MGFKTRFLLYTVPGQVFYNATRKLVLKGADAIVFVADSEVGKMEENKESLANLRTNLAEYGLSLDEIPWVIQYNKRDLPNVYTVEELDAELNPGGKVPFFEAVATTGKGVFETFRGVSHLLMEKVTKDLRRTPFANAAARAVPAGEEPPAKAEPARTQAPSPLSPQWSIAHEAQETVARESEGPAGLDYGREISLPGESAPRLKAVAAAAGVPPVARPRAPLRRPRRRRRGARGGPAAGVRRDGRAGHGRHRGRPAGRVRRAHRAGHDHPRRHAGDRAAHRAEAGGLTGP